MAIFDFCKFFIVLGRFLVFCIFSGISRHKFRVPTRGTLKHFEISIFFTLTQCDLPPRKIPHWLLAFFVIIEPIIRVSGLLGQNLDYSLIIHEFHDYSVIIIVFRDYSTIIHNNSWKSSANQENHKNRAE